MKSNHQAAPGFAAGFAAGLVALVLVLGGAATALVESGFTQQSPLAAEGLQGKTLTPAPSVTATSTRRAASPSSTPKPATSTSRPTLPASPTPSQTPCPPPAGWISYTVGVSDTLPGLASSLGITEALVIEANCLVKGMLPEGGMVYLPPSPTPTSSPTAGLRLQCQPPQGWVSWVAQPGDTWESLASATGVGSLQLQAANCYDINLVATPGQTINLPRLPSTATASPGSTPVAPRPFSALALTPTTSPRAFPVQPVMPVIRTPAQPSGSLPSTPFPRTATP